MIDPEIFIESLRNYGIDFFVGVPDSLLKEFCRTLQNGCHRHLIAANEGNAVAMAIGHHLATGRFAAVYMQNSGLGNAINPLVSLAAPEIYGVGMLLIIGWRGEPGVKDEPQHLLQGQITIDMLKTARIPYAILDGTTMVDEVLANLLADGRLANGPAALVIRKDSFAAAPAARATAQLVGDNGKGMLREAFIELLLGAVPESALLIATTGFTSREVFEIRARRSEPQRDFLTVGGMGHASSIALAIALDRPDRRVFCLDGDGAMLMHLGAMPVIGCGCRPANFVQVMLNNGVHESVGGQPIVASSIDIRKMAEAFGFRRYFRVECNESAVDAIRQATVACGPVFIEAVIRPGTRKDLGRPTRTPAENRQDFMRFIDEQL